MQNFQTQNGYPKLKERTFLRNNKRIGILYSIQVFRYFLYFGRERKLNSLHFVFFFLIQLIWIQCTHWFNLLYIPYVTFTERFSKLTCFVKILSLWNHLKSRCLFLWIVVFFPYSWGSTIAFIIRTVKVTFISLFTPGNII